MVKSKAKQASRDTTDLTQEVDNSTSLGKLILGLMDEIKAAEKSAVKFILKDGVFTGPAGDLYIYEFPLFDEFPFQQESNLIINIGKKTGIRGYMHALGKNAISIASEEFVDGVLDQISITNSEGALLERLKDILADLSKNPTSIPFSSRNASFVLAEGQPVASPLKEIPEGVSRCIKEKDWILNVEQDKAVRVGMGGEMLLLWGPPGTGKTTTIALMLSALANAGESVLLVSNTNKAVDGALEKIIPNLETLGITETGACLRMGQGATDGFRQTFGAKSDLKTVAAERNKELIREQSELIEHRKPLVRRLAKVRADLQEYVALEASRTDLVENNQHLYQLSQDIQLVEQELSRLKATSEKLDTEKFNAPETPGLFGLLGFTRTKVEIEKEIQGIQSSIAGQETARLAAKNSFQVVQDKMTHLTKTIQTAEDAVSNLLDRSILETEAQELDGQVSTIDSRLAEIEKKIADTEQLLIDNAKVIGTTVYKAFLDQRLLKKQWDVVLVDEVSMLLLPMTYFAAGKATKRVILVGDFLQLPSIVAADTKLVEDWVKADPFRKWCVNDSKIRKENPPAVFVALREQNRMHEEICNLISKTFYGQWLVTAPKVKSRIFTGPSLGEKNKRILWIDTSDLNGWSTKRYGKGSLFNITHAALIGEIVDTLASKGYFDGVNSDDDKNSVGVVTPYAAQQKLISALLAPVKKYVDVDSIGTAHKFQGVEKDTIIIDMVEASFRPSRFINAEEYNDDAGRLMNVGLSRAREYLIVIVNKRAFETKGSRFMQQLFNRIETMSERIDPTALFRDSKYFDSAREITVGREVAISAKNVLFTEQDFYPAVMSDLFSASKSIVIFSAFMTTVGTTRWLAVLSKAMLQGTKVRIVTKTLDRQPRAGGVNGEPVRRELSDLVQLMRKSGIAVDLRSETHEKVIVVDERVVWNGSLNVLSQVKDSTREHMTRTEDVNYACEILALMSRHDMRSGITFNSEHPVCPSCGARTYLGTGIKGTTRLKCEDECGWSVKQELFKKLSQGIPVGKIIKKCTESNCKGWLQLRHSYGRYFLGCKNFPTCNHKEDVHAGQFQYDPFPSGPDGDLSILSTFYSPKCETSAELPQTEQSKVPDTSRSSRKNSPKTVSARQQNKRIVSVIPVSAKAINELSGKKQPKKPPVDLQKKSKPTKRSKSGLEFLTDLAVKCKLEK